MTSPKDNQTERKLNEQQQDFVLHYTSTPGAIGNGSEAARRAGYSEKSAAELARQLLEKPHVRNAIFDANRAAISGRLCTKAVNILERVLDDESASLKVRVDAAKTVLDRAGFVTAVVSPEDPYRKSLSEMTREELENVCAQGAEVLRLAEQFANAAGALN
ncbi:MAG: terminase small subunit [Pseudomonadota bacterium]